MSFEYIIEKDNSTKKLNEEQEENLVKVISSRFAELNRERRQNLEMASDLANEIFFKNEFKPSGDKTQRWKSKIKMCKTFMFYQTLKSFIWRNTYANVNSMFDVSGENHDSNNASNKQKAMLVDIMEKMDYQKTCDQIIDYALLYGELISFTSWKKTYEEYRRPITFFERIFPFNAEKRSRIQAAVDSGKNYFVDERKVYDNPYIYPVNPADLVFDPNQSDNWDSCPKIYRTYKTASDIINNQLYTITDEAKETIEKLVLKNNSINKIKTEEEVVKGSTIEVLEHWGDLKLSDGTLLKNWHAVVVARKFLVLFHKNDAIINPFSYGAFVKDPVIKRGISPLYSVLSLAHVQEDLLNRTCNLQTLSENPPLLAPEGFFDEDEIQLYPGKIIEYGDNLSPTAAFKQLTFNPNVFLQDITFLNDLMSEVSGIFPNMVGAVELSGAKTATEINTKTQGQMTRLAMIVDIINQDLIIPNVEKVAKLCADFKSGVETIFVNHENQQDYIEVDDEVRQGDYKYTYSDSSTTSEKSQQADLVVTAVEKFAQLIPLDMQEIFIWYFEQKGVDNPERFLMQQLPSAPLEGEVSAGQRGVNEEGAGVNGVNGAQLTAGNPAGSEENINPAHNATQPQQEADINSLQGQPQEQISNEPQAELSADQINQGQNPKLDINQLITLLTMINQMKGNKDENAKSDFMSVINEMLNGMEEK